MCTGQLHDARENYGIYFGVLINRPEHSLIGCLWPKHMFGLPLPRPLILTHFFFSFVYNEQMNNTESNTFSIHLFTGNNYILFLLFRKHPKHVSNFNLTALGYIIIFFKMHSSVLGGEGTVYALFTLFYIFFAACLVAPPTEFISAGLTVQNILSSVLGSETMHFVYYHIRRTTATMILHSVLPLGMDALVYEKI